MNDLMVIKIWFDKLAGGESIACSTVIEHSIHQPVSAAPAQVPDLVPIWNEYQSALATGQQCLDWLWLFCLAGGGGMDDGTFWGVWDLSSAALSQSQHVVQALEAR